MRRRFCGTVKDFTANYLTIEALEDGLTVSLHNSFCFYCIDGDEDWRILQNDSAVTIDTGQTISFKDAHYNSSFGCGQFVVDKQFNLVGNAMSMLFGDNAKDAFDLSGYSEAFVRMFSGCVTLQSISTNFLPATTLAYSCYNCMFWGCTSLTEAPELPATTLDNRCYYGMFSNCTSLTIAPELPAMTLADDCYDSMFQDCTSLTTAPALPATTLASHCYHDMFFNCTSLVNAPELPATTLAYRCYNCMFWGCTSLVTAPELPAVTLTEGCYVWMFYGCRKLNYIKAMFTTTPSITYTDSWVTVVASSGTFVKNKNATWNVTGPGGIPHGWTVQTA